MAAAIRARGGLTAAELAIPAAGAVAGGGGAAVGVSGAGNAASGGGTKAGSDAAAGGGAGASNTASAAVAVTKEQLYLWRDEANTLLAGSSGHAADPAGALRIYLEVLQSLEEEPPSEFAAKILLNTGRALLG